MKDYASIPPRERAAEAAADLRNAAWRGVGEDDYRSMVAAAAPPNAEEYAMGWYWRAAATRRSYVRMVIRQRHKLVAPQVVKAKPQFKRARF
jgi:hypothetical protein